MTRGTQSGPLRVLYLIGSFRKGGAERSLTRLLPRLDSHRFAPQVACFEESGTFLEEVRAACPRVHDLEVRPPLHAPRNLLRLARLVGLLRRERIELVHSYLVAANIFGVLAARLAGIPVVAGLRNVDTAKSRRLMRAQMFALRRASLLLAVSEEVREAYAERGLPRERVGLWENGIEVLPPPESREESRRRLGVPPEAVVVTTVARLKAKKNHQGLLEAARVVCRERPEALFLLAGTGPLLAELESRVRELGLEGRVRFLGEVEDIPRLLNGSDLFCLPSLMEGMSNALLEAMACGLPAVATAVGASPEMVEDGRSGLVIPAGEVGALSGALLSLVADGERRRRFGEAARTRVQERYSIQRMVLSLEDHYSRCLPAGRMATAPEHA